MPHTARPAGLDGTQLKLLAAALMLLDHIHYMFAGLAPVPGWFTVVGRLAAPVFLFLLAEGFAHTHDRRRYFVRVWLVAAGMGAVSYGMRVCGLWLRGDGFWPINGIFLNFPLLFCLWQGIDWLRQGTPRRTAAGLAALALPWLWPELCTALYGVLGRLGWALPARALRFATYTVLPRWDLITDGGLVYLLEGLVLYALRGQRRRQLAGYAVTALAMEFFVYGQLWQQTVPGFAWGQMFTDIAYCQWMSVFSTVLMAAYNGRRGRGLKWAFYLFYPAHVYALYALSCALYPVLR